MKRTIYRSMLVALAGVGLLCAQNGNGNSQGNDNNSQGNDNSGDTKPDGKGDGNGTKFAHSGGQSKTGGNGISYHGGPIITGTTNVYYIWYGNWSADTIGQNILTVLAKSIGGSPYFNINTTYYNGSSVHVSNSVAYGTSAVDNYSQGKNLSDTGVQNVVTNAINSGALPKDTNGVYFVLTSADVNETSGFCSQYCGWHWFFTLSGSNIKYAFVGNPARCPSACAEQTVTPNSTPGYNALGPDSMASIISHELEESATDPLGTAWYDSRGNENADKCAWTFGTETKLPNGAYYNVNLGGTNFLIQRNWVNAAGGYCAMSY